MSELLTSAIDAVREGAISPSTLIGLLVLGLLAWAARKGGEKLLSSVSGLLAEGEKIRKNLNSQLDASQVRSADLQRQRDEAITALADARVEGTRSAEQVRALEVRNRDLEDEVQDLNDQLRRARLRAIVNPENE